MLAVADLIGRNMRQRSVVVINTVGGDDKQSAAANHANYEFDVVSNRVFEGGAAIKDFTIQTALWWDARPPSLRKQ